MTGNEQAHFFRNICRKTNNLRPSLDRDFVVDTFVSAGTVILAVAVAGDSRADQITELTCFPIEFVNSILDQARTMNLWSSESFIALKQSLTEISENLFTVDEHASWATEDFWNADSTDNSLLHLYRGGIIVGGAERHYPNNDDTEALSEDLYTHVEGIWSRSVDMFEV